MEIITKEGQKSINILRRRIRMPKAVKRQKVGIAYELDNGEIIYVPEE